MAECLVLRQALLNKEPVVIHLDKNRETLSYQEAGALLASHINYVAVVPMVSKGRGIGLMVLSESRSWQREPFTQEKMAIAVGMAEQAAVAVDNANLFVEVQDSYDATLNALASALDAREQETQNHSQRVAYLTAFLTEKMGVAENDIPAIRQGALLHDIGKIGVSDKTSCLSRGH